jgi:hypothetical protein
VARRLQQAADVEDSPHPEPDIRCSCRCVRAQRFLQRVKMQAGIVFAANVDDVAVWEIEHTACIKVIAASPEAPSQFGFERVSLLPARKPGYPGELMRARATDRERIQEDPLRQRHAVTLGAHLDVARYDMIGVTGAL